MGYYLLDHKNPHGQHFYLTSKVRKVARVMHITAGLQGVPGGHDSSAERTAAYAASTDRAVSWHVGTDCDSIVRLLPTEAVAFHVRGYNSPTIGHEISKKDTSWGDENPDWVEKTLRQAARAAAEDCRKHGIPVRRISKAQLDAAIRVNDPSKGGFVSHAELDPTRRTDPGFDFPWDRFLNYVREALGQPVTPPAPPAPTGGRNVEQTKATQRAVRVTSDGFWGDGTDRAVNLVRAALNGRFPAGVKATQVVVGTTPDGAWGPKSRAALVATVKALQAAWGTTADGAWGPKTQAAYEAARRRNYKTW